MSHNKKLSIVALVALQSALMLSSQQEATGVWNRGLSRNTRPRLAGVQNPVGEMPGIEMPVVATQALADHAERHAAHTQVVAQEANDHANVMRVVADHLTTKQDEAVTKLQQLNKSISTVQNYIDSPNSKNGTLKKGDAEHGNVRYVEYKKAAASIRDHARQSLMESYKAVVEAYDILSVLPKNTVEDKTVEAELKMVMNALHAVLQKS